MARLCPIGEAIWYADGPAVPFFGWPYPTRMVVIRLKDGDLFVWSPIARAPALQSEVEALGRVAHLVSPNPLHHLSLPAWKAAFPDAKVYASPGLRRKRRDIAFDAELGDAPETAWAADIDQIHVAGSFVMSEIVFVHRPSATAIFADLIENFPPGSFGGWRETLARLDGIMSPDCGAPREWRATFWNRRRARQALSRVLAHEPRQVIMAHGEIVRSDGARFIRKAFRWLEP